MFTFFKSNCEMWRELTFLLIIISSTDLVITSGSFVDPTVNCHTKYVAEGESLDCDCRLSLSNTRLSDILLSWPGYSDNSRLKVMNVTRTDNGTVFTCLVRWREQKWTANYTLQVAYGPDDEHTTIHGPPSFVTDGTKDMTLTCEATEVHPLPLYTWDGFSCLNDDTDRGVCVLKPHPPWDDGSEVHCTARSTAVNNHAGKSTYSLNLTYPPLKPPVIYGIDDWQMVKDGENIHCIVSGGKPLVMSVNFTCLSDPPHEDQPDVRTVSSVMSSLTISSEKIKGNTTECVCNALWEQDEGLYSYNSTVFVVLDTQSPERPGVFLDIIFFGAGGGGGAFILLTFISLIAASRWKKGREEPPAVCSHVNMQNISQEDVYANIL